MMRGNKKKSKVFTVKDALLMLRENDYKIFYIDDNKNNFAYKGKLWEKVRSYEHYKF